MSLLLLCSCLQMRLMSHKKFSSKHSKLLNEDIELIASAAQEQESTQNNGQ
jgi:hypothetical protein